MLAWVLALMVHASSMPPQAVPPDTRHAVCCAVLHTCSVLFDTIIRHAADELPDPEHHPVNAAILSPS